MAKLKFKEMVLLFFGILLFIVGSIKLLDVISIKPIILLDTVMYSAIAIAGFILVANVFSDE